MNLITAAQAALNELLRLHSATGACCAGPDNCPTAAAIRDLELAIGEEKLRLQHPIFRPDPKPEDIAFFELPSHDPVFTAVAPFKIEDAPERRPVPRTAFMPAQRLCITCDQALMPGNQTNTCPACKDETR